MAFVIELSKETFKFSGTHFTIFDSKNAERLHGHNYYVTVKIEVEDIQSDLGFAFDFNAVKPLVRNICSSWDECVLLPARSPFLKIKTGATQIEVAFANKQYSFPATDVVLLPIVNVTVEELSRLFGQLLLAELMRLSDFPMQQLHWLSIGIQETHGQRVVYRQLLSGSSG